MGDFGILISQYNSALPTLVDGQYSELQTDDKGRLVISGRWLGGTDSWADGDAGVSMMAVRNDAGGALSGVSDGNYSPLQVDAQGRLIVNAQVTLDIGAEKLEDDVHSSGDQGNYILAVRADVRPTDSNVSADGDYASFFVNDSGELYIKDTDALAKLTEIDVVLDAIKVDTASMVVDLAAIEVEQLAQGVTLDGILTDTTTIAGDTTSIDASITALSHAEDSPHVSGDLGTLSLGVRNDNDTVLTSADGDYSPISVDSAGRLKLAGAGIEGSEAFTVTDSLAGAGDGLETITAAGTPWITVASISHTSGTAFIYGYQWACDQNAQMRLVTDVLGTVTYYKTDINSSATPGKSEHWSKDGRIEIAGIASLELKIQIKKRSTPGGNAQGTGSLHIRTI